MSANQKPRPRPIASAVVVLVAREHTLQCTRTVDHQLRPNRHHHYHRPQKLLANATANAHSPKRKKPILVLASAWRPVLALARNRRLLQRKWKALEKTTTLMQRQTRLRFDNGAPRDRPLLRDLFLHFLAYL